MPLQNTKSRSQPSKKRAKKRIPKEADLDENEALVGSYVMKLNDKYVCDIQNHKHCFIKEDRHLSLNNFAISLWAKEIVCNFIVVIFYKQIFDNLI